MLYYYSNRTNLYLDITYIAQIFETTQIFLFLKKYDRGRHTVRHFWRAYQTRR